MCGRTMGEKWILLVKVSNILNIGRKDALLCYGVFCCVSLGFKGRQSSCILRKCLDMIIPISLILLSP